LTSPRRHAYGTVRGVEAETRDDTRRETVLFCTHLAEPTAAVRKDAAVAPVRLLEADLAHEELRAAPRLFRRSRRIRRGDGRAVIVDVDRDDNRARLGFLCRPFVVAGPRRRESRGRRAVVRTGRRPGEVDDVPVHAEGEAAFWK